MNYKDFFKGKNIAVIGLGPHGEMVADLKFLLRQSSKVSFYDMRSESRIAHYLAPLHESGLTHSVFGRVLADELVGFDLIIISHEISRKAFFLRKATEAGVRIEYSHVLFLKLAPAVTLIGVMGACGKSTVSHMIYGMLKKSFSEYDGQGLFFVDPDLTNGALTHLKKIKAGDVVLARIPEDMMAECYAAHISPHVAVITSLTSSMEQGSKHSFGIVEHQTHNNFIVAPDDVIDALKKQKEFTPKAKMLRTKHDNSALAAQTGELFKVSPDLSSAILESFVGLKGHQELVKKIDGIEFYNDASSTTPHSTFSALKALSKDKNIILIFGGAYTGYDYTSFIEKIPQYVSAVVLLPGSGSIGFRSKIEDLSDVVFVQVANLEDAVKKAKEMGKKGDRVLFSPGCAAVGVDASRRERGEKFVKLVRSL